MNWFKIRVKIMFFWFKIMILTHITLLFNFFLNIFRLLCEQQPKAKD